jgi:hypothetical protein
MLLTPQTPADNQVARKMSFLAKRNDAIGLIEHRNDAIELIERIFLSSNESSHLHAASISPGATALESVKYRRHD